ncbi:MAG: 7-carboxy-7-deazaguanine synthase QueE [Bacteroidetes bacterium]|nr:7-carboxy-7-deazaguanine synthase QueE [Bacteroidota bacterium]
MVLLRIVYSTKNIVPQDQVLLDEGKLLPLMEAFYTIQGEGYNTGKAAYFIRVGGCDVGCHWCDVKESWDASIHPLTPTRQIVQNVLSESAKAVVVTGGEPFMYNLTELTRQLKQQGVGTFIETSGAYAFSGTWDWVCLSPKKTKKPLPENYAHAHELKIIIHNKHDFVWAEEEASKVSASCYLFLQPEWSKREEITPLLVAYVKQHPKWMVSLQTHKYIHIP